MSIKTLRLVSLIITKIWQ